MYMTFSRGVSTLCHMYRQEKTEGRECKGRQSGEREERTSKQKEKEARRKEGRLAVSESERPRCQQIQRSVGCADHMLQLQSTC